MRNPARFPARPGRRPIVTGRRPAATLRRLAATATATLLLLAGCGKGKDGKPAARPQDAAVAAYGKLVGGDYEGFVAAMESCDDKPGAYREQMVTLMKQHYTEKAREHGGLRGVSVIRTAVLRDSVAANVFLSVAYGNGDTVEVVQPMVWDGRGWRLQ